MRRAGFKRRTMALGGRGMSSGAFGLLALLAALALYMALAVAPVSAQSTVRPPGQTVEPDTIDEAQRRIQAQGAEPSTDLWRAVREGRGGTTPALGPEAGILIQSQGIAWRAWHNAVVSNAGGWLLIAILGIITAYYFVRGRIPIEGGRTGRVIPRFTLMQRVVHWVTAILFVLLALSGLVLLFGKYLLAPLIGAGPFSVIASASMQGHNLFGPLFLLSTIALLIVFARGNGYALVDLKWLAKGGGFLGGHASSHKYNFGEKTWFWWAVVMGLALSVSGFALLFPDALPNRTAAQMANLVHAVAAIGYIAFGIGHAYLGGVGMEGALEGMTTGTVDEAWAKEHHDLWWADHVGQATTDRTRAEVLAAARGDRAATVAGLGRG